MAFHSMRAPNQRWPPAEAVVAAKDAHTPMPSAPSVQAPIGGGSLSTVLAADGESLALHSWMARGSRTVIFYVHGIQSHAGWLAETGEALRSQGVSLCALDRRGSGRSGGLRGHLPSHELLLDDYRRGMEVVRERSAGSCLIALGQSMGGSVLAGMWVGGLLDVDALVFVAPALGQQRARHDPAELARLRRLSGLARSPIGLRDEDYTEESRYLDLLARDELMLREVTDQTRATLVCLEDSYMLSETTTRAEPVLLAVPRNDSIIDLQAARAVLDLLAPRHRETVFAADCHYLEFSRARREYLSWLVDLAREVGRG